jgi:hypothetical protein
MAGPLWNMHEYRADAAAGWPSEPTPEPEPLPPEHEEEPVTVICATAGAHYLCTFGSMGVIIVPISSPNDSTAFQKEFKFCGVLSEGQWQQLRSREYIPQQLAG